MKPFFFLLIVCYIAATALVLGYDAVTAFVERYSHFHIGRWSDTGKWKSAVENVCRKWSVRTPTLRLRKPCRYLLLDRIRGTYGKAMVQSWQKAGCILGLQEAGDSHTLTICKKQLLDADGNWIIPVNKIDYAMLAYAILRSAADPSSVRSAMDHMIRCIEDNLCPDGMVSYSAGKTSNRRYVDTLGFVCPFLALYGRIYQEPRYVRMAVEQLRLFRRTGLMQQLPVHCYRPDTGMPLGIWGWGRGTGWYTLGLIDLYPELPEGADRDEVTIWIREIAEACLEFEGHDGGFSAILPAGTPYDSSATAMLGYFYARCGEIFGDMRYTQLASRCRTRLMKMTMITGIIDECQGDTIDLGIFSERYAPMPFAQGVTLRLASVLDRTTED